jgi:class 3 adenylate cyclase
LLTRLHFPLQVRERLFEEKARVKGMRRTVKSKLKRMMTTGNFNVVADEVEENDFMYKSKPIADLFPETTILFADIAGFTAWSSVREPSQVSRKRLADSVSATAYPVSPRSCLQVFILLETLFRSFDDIAKKRRVFKVETVGDCYVAVTGLPDPRKDHAVAMARYANDCMTRMRWLSKKLEVTLGPDTGDLSMRMGALPLFVVVSCLARRRTYPLRVFARRHPFWSRNGGRVARRTKSIPALW